MFEPQLISIACKLAVVRVLHLNQLLDFTNTNPMENTEVLHKWVKGLFCYI